MKITTKISFTFILLSLFGCTQQNEEHDMTTSIQSSGNQVQFTLGKGSPINPLLFSSNSVHETSEDPASSEAYRSMLRALNINGIRYPSGSPASFWDWQTGHFIPDDEITAIWPAGGYNWMLELVEDTRDVPDHVLGPVKFMEFGNAINAEVQWMLNLTTRENDQIAALQTLKDKGADIKYVEMDNETYFWGEEFGKDEPALNYVKRVQTLSPTIRQMYPGVKIGIVTREDDLFEASHEPESENNEAMANWNPTIMGEEFRPHFDALILHHYVMKKQKLAPYKNDIDRGKAFLAYPTATLERAARLIKQRFGDYKMWITEYNVIAYYPQFHGTGESAQWMLQTRDSGWNSLYQASFILNAMNNPDAIEVLNHHSISNLDHGWGLGAPVDETSGQISKMGQLFTHLSGMAKTYDSMHALNFNNNPTLGVTIEGDADQGALYGAALTRQQGTALWIINRSNHPITLDTNAFAQYNNAVVNIYPAIEDAPATAVLNYQSETPLWLQGPIKLEQKPVATNQPLAIPAFSFAIVEMNK